jgi:hypothetical protein
MDSELDLRSRARSLSYQQRANILKSFPETELHRNLKELLERMKPGAVVEVTHGPDEFGKDIVLISDDPLGKLVAGFVVKTGSIRGQTAGVVDNILSQVKQARTYPAKLHSVAEPQAINQVYVVVAGDISKNATERISREIRGGVQGIWDVAKLVEEFTQHYPQVFFEGRFVDFLEKRIAELEQHYSFTAITANKNLSEWFVDPVVASADIVDEDQYTDETFIERISKFSLYSLKGLIKRDSRFLLIGEPGSGKSSALAKLAVDMMRDAFTQITRERGHKNAVPVPIMLNAAQLLSYDTCDTMMHEQFQEGFDSSSFEVRLLLVDGLDEVKTELRQEVLGRALEFANEFRCPLIVGMRLAGGGGSASQGRADPLGSERL